MTDDAVSEENRIYTTLSDAAIYWGKPSLVKKLKLLSRLGYSEMTALGHVLGRETPRDRLEDPYCHTVDLLRNELLGKLRAEELVAVGYSSTSQSDVPRRHIHCGLWLTLKADFTNNSAQGGGFDLFGILVTTPGQPPVVASAKPIFVLSNTTKSVRYETFVIELQPRTYQLLQLLAARAIARDPIVSPDKIYKTIFAKETSPNAVRDLVRELRRMLKPLDTVVPGVGKIVETRNQQGYLLRLTADQVAIEA